ncbi:MULTISPECIES: type I restriction-modification system endonuclease [unclassified Nitrobacter]|uniref:type I restriction-modification system endonuclease n=1 Tax=unclassified Nitrobacter TaxID=2620411 RepID=UPI000925A702|nr:MULTISPECIES: type I restriction-modification system endonuclease [unclassified Nitrobacter]MBN9147175.1 type I restriction-modification system endonuclease [Nitrobacter sp.]OJV02327.1 MAG: type I restriction-modification system endonuclease [Nitrobacter sp. 62-23]
MGAISNFSFLAEQDEQLARLGALAERYFFDDAPSTLIKLRQFAEFIAKDVAARHGLLPSQTANFDDVLRVLKVKAALPREIADLFFHLKKLGNAAVHENVGTAAQALTALKIARAAAIWFHQSYGGAPGFKPGPFVPPAEPVDSSAALAVEIEKLRAQVRASADSEAKALLAYQEAEGARLQAIEAAEARQREREFWENYAAETEAGLRQAEADLKAAQAAAEATPPQQLDLLAKLARQQAETVELDEATTRVLIDDQLRAAGWTVDSAVLLHSAGVRPQPGQAIAIAEWPTESGPADYALFVEGRCVGVIEAKRNVKDVPGRLGQAKRYARDIILTQEETPLDSPWAQGLEQFRVPFLFVTNGRPYVKQLATKSGIWFWDARTDAAPHALAEWFSPRDLTERLEQQVGPNITELAEREIGVTGLRPYQQEAILAVEEAIARHQDHILLAMATGTGKTRLAIALMYELLRAKRFRRILFLVDRNALGRQTLDAMSTTDTSGFLKFDQVFPVADLARKFPEATDRVQVATVQAMIRRVFDDPDAERPTPGTYDLIIVDEAHRGYTLDAELREEDLGFRNLDDYLSAYRRVLDYFDATKIALTATPALHTREIFGAPVFRYGYRQAVIDGYLIDHRPPRRITTALSQTGITFDRGEDVNIVDPRTGQIDLFNLDDQVDFEVAEFNKKVYTRAFNRAVAEAVAAECPPNQPGKTLLFAARDDHADILVEELRAALTDEYGPQPHDIVEKITGSVDKPLDRIKVFKNDPRPKYVVTVDLLTTGIDIPSIVNLVFVRRVNSRILYDQMIGRATRRCDEIGKEYFRIFDAVDIYANLQEVTDMRPVVVNPALTFATLVSDLERATTDDDRAYVRDQIIVKLRQRLRHINQAQRDTLETVLGPLDTLADRLTAAPPADTITLFRQHPALATVLDGAQPDRPRDGIFISEHEDELVSVEDNFGGRASPGDYIEHFEAFVRANMNKVPALVAATQRPRELTRKELKELAVLLDAEGFSEASLRRAYGSARNADIAAHIIGFVRQAALGDPLVPYETRVENGVQRLLASRSWTPKQKQWLTRIGRVLKAQPVGDPEILSDPLFAQAGGFEVIDREFNSGLTDVLKDLNAAIWDGGKAA